MTKKQLTVVFIITIAFYFWWQNSGTKQNSAPNNFPKASHFLKDKRKAAPQSPPATVNRNEKTPGESARILTKTLPTLKPGDHHRGLKTTSALPASDAVPFKTYKGMAIAYGDVLLGTVQENIKEGYTTPPDVTFWPSSTIPYHIQPNIPHPERILKALSYLSEKTVLEFVPFEEGMSDAIVFESTDEHCFSYVGRISGTQPIFISAGCDWFHIVHEVLHATGLVHEHCRPDRDQFISLLWENIPAPFRSQFEIMPESFTKDWVRYDYDTQSIMHYGSQVFIANSKGYSLLRKDGTTIPEPQGMSAMDIQKINDLFQGR